MHTKHFIVTSYLLILVGYMTLMLTLPMLSLLALSLKVSHGDIQQGMGIIFIMFSLSAICLSALTDIVGANKILLYAQSISIAGLILATTAGCYLQFILACFFIGAGTGCYSSISRAIISKYVSDSVEMKKAYANISILIVVAPFLSTSLSLILEHFSWRLVYGAMAVIEITLLFYSQFILSHESFELKPFKLNKIVSGFLHCLTKRSYVLNLLMTGLMFAIFMQLFSANLRPLFELHFNFGQTVYFFASMGLTFFYVLGILVFRFYLSKIHSSWVRFFALAILLIGLLLMRVEQQVVCVMMGLAIATMAVGILVPSSSSSAMLVIQKYLGSAASMLTFCLACFSGIWSFAEAHLHWGTLHFINLGLLISFALALLLSIGLLEGRSPVE